MKNIILTIVLIISTSMIYCQKSLNDIEGLRKNAISFSFFGATPIIGITYERVLAKNFSAEIGVGIPSIGIGVKILPWKIVPGKLKFQVGFTALYTSTPGFENKNEEFGWRGSVFYFPIGLCFYGRSGFNFGFDLGPAIYSPGDFGSGGTAGSNGLIPWGNLKFGYRF